MVATQRSGTPRPAKSLAMVGSLGPALVLTAEDLEALALTLNDLASVLAVSLFGRAAS